MANITAKFRQMAQDGDLHEGHSLADDFGLSSATNPTDEGWEYTHTWKHWLAHQTKEAVKEHIKVKQAERNNLVEEALATAVRCPSGL